MYFVRFRNLFQQRISKTPTRTDHFVRAGKLKWGCFLLKIIPSKENPSETLKMVLFWVDKIFLSCTKSDFRVRVFEIRCSNNFLNLSKHIYFRKKYAGSTDFPNFSTHPSSKITYLLRKYSKISIMGSYLSKWCI